MNKKINLTITNSKNTINGFEDLHINELDSLFSCSVDMIYCRSIDCFECSNPEWKCCDEQGNNPRRDSVILGKRYRSKTEAQEKCAE